MMRVVVGLITGIFMSLYFMYMFIPMLSSSHTNFQPLLNATDPTIAASFNLGAGFYTAGPFIPLLVGSFIIISVALKRGADE